MIFTLRTIPDTNKPHPNIAPTIKQTLISTIISLFYAFLLTIFLNITAPMNGRSAPMIMHRTADIK
jgi:hypothetical protein